MVKARIRQMEALFSRLAAALRGRKTPPPLRLQTAQDVIDLLQEQAQAVRDEPCAGAVEKAQALGYLAAVARKAIETGQRAARLEVLEAVLKQRSGESRR